MELGDALTCLICIVYLLVHLVSSFRKRCDAIQVHHRHRRSGNNWCRRAASAMRAAQRDLDLSFLSPPAFLVDKYDVIYLPMAPVAAATEAPKQLSATGPDARTPTLAAAATAPAPMDATVPAKTVAAPLMTQWALSVIASGEVVCCIERTSKAAPKTPCTPNAKPPKSPTAPAPLSPSLLRSPTRTTGIRPSKSAAFEDRLPLAPMWPKSPADARSPPSPTSVLQHAAILEALCAASPPPSRTASVRNSFGTVTPATANYCYSRSSSIGGLSSRSSSPGSSSPGSSTTPSPRVSSGGGSGGFLAGARASQATAFAPAARSPPYSPLPVPARTPSRRLAKPNMPSIAGL